jgi:hypothetical protein
MSLELLNAANPDIYRVRSRAPGPGGSLPLTEELLLSRPSGDIFGLTQNAGMGWAPAEVGRKSFLILSTQGGVRAPDGKPVALGYHTGHHWKAFAEPERESPSSSTACGFARRPKTVDAPKTYQASMVEDVADGSNRPSGTMR